MSEVLERLLLDLRDRLDRQAALTQASLKEIRDEAKASMTLVTGATEALTRAIAELKKKRTVLEDNVLKSFELRDAEMHFSDVAEVGDYNIFLVLIRNELDKTINIQVLGNSVASSLGAAVLTPTFTVAAGEVAGKTLSVYAGEWVPYACLKYWASEAPTKGYLHASIYKRSI